MVNQEMLNLLVEAQARMEYYADDEIAGGSIINDTNLFELSQKIGKFLAKIDPEHMSIALAKYKEKYDD